MIWTILSVIVGIYLGQEFNFPNVRDTYMYWSSKFLEYQQDRRTFSEEPDETEESTLQQFLKKIKENLNM